MLMINNKSSLLIIMWLDNVYT